MKNTFFLCQISTIVKKNYEKKNGRILQIFSNFFQSQIDSKEKLKKKLSGQVNSYIGSVDS